MKFTNSDVVSECPPELFIEETQTELPSAPITSEESDTGDVEGRQSSENSPSRQRRGGILKGGRLWKSLETDKDIIEQVVPCQHAANSEFRHLITSLCDIPYQSYDEDGSFTHRSVRFVERSKELSEDDQSQKSEHPAPVSDSETNSPKETTANTQRFDAPASTQTPKPNSAVQQLFNSSRPPPPAIEPQLVTSETLRAWDAGVRPKTEEAAVRRVAERNALRCSLLRSEARKKQQPKQETTSLAERIRLLTCDVEDEGEEQRPQPAGAPADKYCSSDKSYNSVDRNNEKAFGSASSSSSSSTLSPRPEPRRQFLSTLAPLTACVGSAAHHEGFYYVPPGERASAAAPLDPPDHSDAPAPDVVAGTPGAGDGDDGLAAFARAAGPRTERLRQRYGQESQPASSDDEHDDYGFHRRPAVRGIAVKQQLGASDDILQQMQNELTPATSAAAPAPAHACQRTNSNYSWPYYSEANLNSRPQSRTSASSTWSKSSEYVTARPCAAPTQPTHSDACYAHAQSAAYAHYQHRPPQENELYSSQTSSEQTSPVRSASRCRRPESPPPIRNHHQLLYVPYNAHYHYQHHDYTTHWNPGDYTRMHSYYQQQSRSGASTPQPAQAQPQRAQYTHALQLQVAAPLYQQAPGSPQRSARGAPEGAPAGASAPGATSPMAPPTNPVYYAMNV
ncbi:hypothetical protein MSG28_000913 [Choristoneura fumiferana]|uniref:Uncharacterized protein n=1 Tax=Choristoneura fumiferana TaxID=7141 RepID=A0ACC0K2T4_CHOFU|nr:hypothetical protein MSG28_000913 [Choristoneura fumiferana]